MIRFSKNWNKKLNADYFTTIRIPGAKYKIGNVLPILVKDVYIYDAKVIAVKNIAPEKITDWLTLTDAGMSKHDFAIMMYKMYPNYDFAIKPLSIVLLRQLPPKDRYRDGVSFFNEKKELENATY